MGPERLAQESLTERKRFDTEPAGSERRLRALASELAHVQELERRRIASGLHDDVGQLLGVAKVKLGEALAVELPAESADHVREARRLVNRAIEETRALTFELGAPLLHDLGLVPALEYLAERMTERHGIPCRFEADPTLGPLGEEVATTLHSIVRELLWNIAKHARAGEAELTIRRHGRQLRVVVRDDGTGFDTARAAPDLSENGGFGLFAARQRLEHLGGGLEVDSAPGKGTRVLVTCPANGGPGEPA